jgi:hypothetical protein
VNLQTYTPAAKLVGLPKLIGESDASRLRFLEFFTAQIRNPNTRRSYAKAAVELLEWCEARNGACRKIFKVNVLLTTTVEIPLPM